MSDLVERIESAVMHPEIDFDPRDVSALIASLAAQAAEIARLRNRENVRIEAAFKLAASAAEAIRAKCEAIARALEEKPFYVNGAITAKQIADAIAALKSKEGK